MSTSKNQPKDKVASYGRGGAGNMSTKANSPAPDLVTPSIKSDMYTTGRGGQGNMAKNDPNNPSLARESQDVNVPPRRLSQGESHYGRGGAANTVKMTPEEVARAKEENAHIAQSAREKEMRGKDEPLEKIKGMAEKGKDLLKGGKST